MKGRKKTGFAAGAICMLLLGAVFAADAGCASLPLDRIKLPPGFEIGVYAEIPEARSLAASPAGTLFVGSRRAGTVHAVSPGSQGRAGRVHRIASGLDSPNGVAFRDGALYVAEVSRILRYDGIEKRLDDPPRPIVVRGDFPGDRHHGWKFIRFGPDGFLYVPVGAPCDVCERKDTRYASIMRMKPDGSGLEVFAHGVRNTVGFDWHPDTKELWFTDNGRDWMGDNRPPDELNRAPRKDLHFGFPYCHGGDIPDPKYGRGRNCGEFTPPAVKLSPHAAALGMRFYTGRQFPEAYRGKIFIAEHGSWNRSTPIGYRITLVDPAGGKPGGFTVFAEGWLQDSIVWGRPVDVEVMPDGSLFVSDDKAGVVYAIRYGRKGK